MSREQYRLATKRVVAALLPYVKGDIPKPDLSYGISDPDLEISLTYLVHDAMDRKEPENRSEQRASLIEEFGKWIDSVYEKEPDLESGQMMRFSCASGESYCFEREGEEHRGFTFSVKKTEELDQF